MNLKTLFALFLATSALAAGAATTVDRVVVRQQWPWSTDVTIEYALVGDASPVDIQVRAWNGAAEVPAADLRAVLSGEIYNVSGTEAIHRMTLDPVALFGATHEALPNFRVELTAVNGALVSPDEVLYKIVDLASGAIEDVRRVDFYNHPEKYGTFETSYAAIDPNYSTSLENVLIWTGVTNDVKYATTKLVLRKIPAGTFTMGSPTDESGRYANETQHDVTFQHNYWIGVFPVTQRQHELLGGMNRSYYTNELYAATRPVENVKYKEDLRGQTVVSDIDALLGDVLFARLRTLTGNVASFDLPTEAQWECACRAGTSGRIYTGGDFTDRELNKIARWKNNSNAAGSARDADDTVGTAPVGRYRPNAYGLYDMVGNVWEICRDTTSGSGSPAAVSEAQTDPILRQSNGTATGTMRRGGGVDFNSALTAVHYRSAFRSAGGVYALFNRPIEERLNDNHMQGYRISFTEK